MHVIAVPWAEDFRWLSSGAILKTKVRSATGYLYNSPSIFLTDCPEDLCLFFLFRDLIQHFIKVKNCKREINSSCLWNKYQGQASMTELCLSFWQMYGIDDVIHIFKKKTTELRKSKLIYPRSHSYQEPSEWVKSLGPVRLCDPMDCSPPGSSVHGIFQARVPERVAISFSNQEPRKGSNPCQPDFNC